MEWLIVLICVGVIIYSLSGSAKAKKSGVAKAKKKEEATVLAEIIQLKEVGTSLMLKRGEVAYFDINSTLSETRAERRSQTLFAGKRNKKSTFFGGSSGRSKSVQVLTTIDSGSLILTNKRLVFDGGKTNRNTRLNKIMSVDIVDNWLFSDQLEISTEGRQKSMYFSVPDTYKYKELIMLAWKDS